MNVHENKNPAAMFIAAINQILDENPNINRKDFILYLMDAKDHRTVNVKVVPTLSQKNGCQCSERITDIPVNEATNPFSCTAHVRFDMVRKALCDYYGFKYVTDPAGVTTEFRQTLGCSRILDVE